MDQKTENRSYIKCRIRLNIDSKQIFNEFCGIYGPQTISMRTVFRWVKAFKAGKFSVEDDSHWPILQESCTEESERVLQYETTKQMMVRSPPFT